MKTTKQRIIVVISIILSFFISICYAESNRTNTPQKKSDFKWPEGKKMGLSLTFDDARLTQPDKGIPLFDKYGVKVTFYVSPDDMIKRLEAWKKAVKNGHEIGNHSVLHPCSGNFIWARQEALEDYTLSRMNAELDSANKIIHDMLGVVPVSFGYPCGQKFVGRGTKTKSYVPLISAMFETGRGWRDEGPNDPAYCDMSQLTGMELDGKSFNEIKKLIESAKSQGLWLVLAGHEINKGGSATSLLSTIEKICKYAMDPSNGIWIDNVHNIASYINQQRDKNESSELLPYQNYIFPTTYRVEELISGLSLEEKTGQLNMTCVYEFPLCKDRERKINDCQKFAARTRETCIESGGGIMQMH